MMSFENINSALKKIKTMAYDSCAFVLSDLTIEPEGKEYKACQFKLNGWKIICRNAKITPKKIGQFVTFWKRNEDGITAPFRDVDEFDFYVINVLNDDRIGQFVFPKSVLIENKIISTKQKDGKRGFRVYPGWDIPNSKQAKKTQEWQTKYFIEFDNEMDLNMVKQLYQIRA